MKIAWLYLVPMCATLAAGFDLGPIIRNGLCRHECLRRHNDNCNSDVHYGDIKYDCRECWRSCEMLESAENERIICAGDRLQSCPGCKTACTYYRAQVADRYEPSMLPAPSKGPISLGPHDVAIVMRRARQQWTESGYYCKNSLKTTILQPHTWVIVVTEDGLRHYSWQEWVPSLDSLKEGPLYEATISWRDMRPQLRRQQEREQKVFNDRVRQLFLEKYGEKVLAEWRGHNDDESRTISRDVFRRFFFKRRDDASEADRFLKTDGSPATGSSFAGSSDGEAGARSPKKQLYVVTWGPETGGLTGNQVTDCDSAQISLLPGTKYLVRVASDDGPGSFPIVVDTRPAANASSSVSSSSSFSSSTDVSSVLVYDLRHFWIPFLSFPCLISLIYLLLYIFARYYYDPSYKNGGHLLQKTGKMDKV